MWRFSVRETEDGVYSHLEDSYDGPQKRVKILPVWQSVSIPLWPKLTTKQMHPQDTDTQGGLDREQTGKRMFTLDQIIRDCTNTLIFTCWNDFCFSASTDCNILILSMSKKYCHLIHFCLIICAQVQISFTWTYPQKTKANCTLNYTLCFYSCIIYWTLMVITQKVAIKVNASFVTKNGQR